MTRTPLHSHSPARRWWAAALVAVMAAASFTNLTGTASADVTTPLPNEAMISVKIGGDRASDGTVIGVEGVRLSLYEAGTATTNSGSTVQGTIGTRYDSTWTWTTCTSDDDGDCNFVIPIRAGAISRTGVPQDTRFWVAQDPSDPSPTDWYSNPTVRLGASNPTPEFAWAYRFRTDIQLRAGVTYQSTTPMTLSTSYLDADRGFMRNREDTNAEGGMGENISRSTGVWSQSRTNPDWSLDCGLKIAVVADTSGSLGTTGIAALKGAIGTFVDGFSGTPTQMSLFSFSNISPGAGATNHPTLLPVTTAAQAATFKAQYSGWSSGGGTSWDRGLAAAANSGNDYDLVVLLTDGNPTVFGATPNNNASAFNSYQDVDAGIFSANQLKAAGARVIALGVGTAVNSPASAFNLRAVSGVTENEDFFRTADFTAAATTLAELAAANCQGSIQSRR